MNSWIICVVSTILITTILNILIPSKRFGTLIKSLFSLVCLLVILKPLINDINFDNVNSFADFSFIEQQGFIEYCINEKENDAVIKCDNLLEQNGIKNAKVYALFDIDENDKIFAKRIEINLKNAVIISDKEHIDIIEEIKHQICDLFEVNLKDIFIYE